MPRNTVDAIETGCRHAQAGAVERMYRVFRDIAARPLCIVAGGAGRTLVDQLSMPRRYVENLVLDGLARIALAERAVRRNEDGCSSSCCSPTSASSPGGATARRPTPPPTRRRSRGRSSRRS